MQSIDRFFSISARGSTVGTEIRAGVTTFLTMAYILFVNPSILAATGMPAADVAIATALASAAATAMMGLYANFPFALAPGMGLNAYFTYGVVLGLGVSWQVALTAVFIEGLLFMALAVSGLRTRLLDAIPGVLKIATTIGIGLFLAIIGFKNAQWIVDHPATLVTLGSVREPSVYMSLLGILVIGALMVRQIKGAILVGILVITVLAWILGFASLPTALTSVPALPRKRCWRWISARFSTVPCSR